MKKRFGYIIVFFVIILIILIIRKFNLAQMFQEEFKTFLNRIEALGIFGPIAFIGLYIIASLLFFSGALLTSASGAFFGVFIGTISSSVGSMFGASLTFFISRYFLRKVITRKMEESSKFKTLDNAVSKEGWKIVALTRLSPVIPFALLNYAYGITKVKFRDFILATWLGMLPCIILYTYIGSLVGKLAFLNESARVKSPFEWFFYIFGLVITIATSVYITRISKRALQEKISETE